jgi:hypothetical protein
LIGKAKSAEHMKKFNISLDVINEIIVYYPNYLPALIEKSLVSPKKKFYFKIKLKIIIKVAHENRGLGTIFGNGK